MLEALLIFNQGGIVLFHHRSEPSLLKSIDHPVSHVRHLLEAEVIHNHSITNQCFKIVEGLTFSWKWMSEICIVAVYPDILFEGPRQYLKQWAQFLVENTCQEFQRYLENQNPVNSFFTDASTFAPTFKVILEHSKSQRHGADSAPTPAVIEPKKKEGTTKERHWRGEAKVTEAAMKALNMNDDDNGENNKDAAYQRALQEARQAYLPTEQEQNMPKTKEEPPSWSSSLSGVLQTLSGSKKLTADDLRQPLEKMKAHLQGKNVSVETSQALCDAVQTKLTGKKLQSFYSIQTAVQQALESTIQQLLLKPIDIVTSIRRKRNKPYLVCVMGINGIGKTTTTAKLAYHFQQKGLKPLLVAADTFRSGAVEQLRVHADCLGVPIYTAGYAKDPTDVVTQALQQKIAADVVLVDTAGRMQTNLPLMQSLSKLIQTHKPDFTVMVCEALVGSDALSQFQVFQRAAGKIDGLILTKVDTVDKKLGAALTLTQESRTPVIFCGVGQKYHHLEPLAVDRVVRALLS